MTESDTPLTDAVEYRHCPPQPESILKKHEDAYALSRELERELNASRAENTKLREIREELAQLAPATKEPTIAKSATIEPVPEWRELGPDEVIQEGDEIKGVGGEWFKVDQTIGAEAGKCGSSIFRTRRPLPNSPEFEGIKEEMPLEDDIHVIDTCSDHSVVEARWATALVLRYLRDEIQKLKEAR